jgi:hypothetical protein
VLLRLFTSPFKSKIRIEAENAILRRQLIALQRKLRGRVRFTNSDRYPLSLVSRERWMRFEYSDPRAWCGGIAPVFRYWHWRMLERWRTMANQIFRRDRNASS